MWPFAEGTGARDEDEDAAPANSGDRRLKSAPPSIGSPGQPHDVELASVPRGSGEAPGGVSDGRPAGQASDQNGNAYTPGGRKRTITKTASGRNVRNAKLERSGTTRKILAKRNRCAIPMHAWRHRHSAIATAPLPYYPLKCSQSAIVAAPLCQPRHRRCGATA